MASANLTCQVWADHYRGRLVYRGAVHDGEDYVWRGGWASSQTRAAAEAQAAAARIEKEREKRVRH